MICLLFISFWLILVFLFASSGTPMWLCHCDHYLGQFVPFFPSSHPLSHMPKDFYTFAWISIFLLKYKKYWSLRQVSSWNKKNMTCMLYQFSVMLSLWNEKLKKWWHPVWFCLIFCPAVLTQITVIYFYCVSSCVLFKINQPCVLKLSLEESFGY